MVSVVPITARALVAAGGGNGGVIATLIVGFLVVDAVAILLIWLAMRKRRDG